MYNEPTLSNEANTRVEFFDPSNEEYPDYLVDAMVEGKNVEIIDVHVICTTGYVTVDKNVFWNDLSNDEKADLTERLITEYESNLESSYFELSDYKKSRKSKKMSFDDDFGDDY